MNKYVDKEERITMETGFLRKIFSTAALIATMTALAALYGCDSFGPAGPPEYAAGRPASGDRHTDARDRQAYYTVRIGNAAWMAENLNYSGHGSGASWCYNDNPSYCRIYGRLYNYEAASTACPDGWRLPTEYDYEKLRQAAGGDLGATLKSEDNWDDEDNGANSIGFSALPGGQRGANGAFSGLFYSGYFWGSHEISADRARSMGLFANHAAADFTDADKNSGFSVRCVKPDPVTLTVNRNPSVGGSAFVNNTLVSPTANPVPGVPVPIRAEAASGYRFRDWTVNSYTDGEWAPVLSNANDASAAITLYSNAAITANFQRTYTLTIALNMPSGGRVFINNAEYTAPVIHDSGTTLNLRAELADLNMYVFHNWTVTTGSADIAEPNNTNTQILLSADATVTANFKEILRGTPVIDGLARVGDALTVNADSLNGSGALSCEWAHYGTNTVLNGNGCTYIVQSTDIGRQIFVIVSREDTHGTVVSDRREPIQAPTVGIPSTPSPWVGNTLTVHVGNIGGNISYSWKRNGTTTVGSASTYTISANDTGSTITVEVNGFSSNNSVGPVPKPVVTALGTPYVGNSLTVDIQYLGGTSRSYRWMRGANVISGATGETYTIQSGDAGHDISVEVNGFKSNSRSVPMPVITASGTPWVGNSLTASAQYLGGTSRTYQWRRGSSVISGETGSTYTITSNDINYTITAVVNGFASTPTNSVPEPVITVSGTHLVGNTLTAVAQYLGGTARTYQWRRGSGNISGATSGTYTVQPADVGYNITVSVNGYTSATVGAVPTPSVSISSTTTPIWVGHTLTAVPANLGVTPTYQWYRSATSSGTLNIISGATGSTYTLAAADGSMYISVRAYVGSSNYYESNSVGQIIPNLTGSVNITGTLVAGQTLTATPTALSGTGTITYEWRRSSGTSVIGTGNTYTLSSDDVGSTITVTVRRADRPGSVISTPTSTITAPPTPPPSP